jgi:D-alanine transaminase
MRMSTIFYYNGRFVESGEAQVPLEDRGHQFGDGVYEVVRVYGGRPFLLDWHLERFERSCAAIGLHNPHSREEWVQLISEAIRRSGEAEAQVYWQLTRGAAARNHLFPEAAPAISLIVRPQPERDGPAAVSLLAYPDERWSNVFVKTINLLPNAIAKEAAHRAGAGEALLVRDGVITEGSGSNAWFVRGGKLYTAPANRHILPGITRRFVLELAESLGLEVREEAVTFAELDTVDEVFMTGTTTEILAVHQIVVDRTLRERLLRPSAEPPTILLYELVDPVVVWSRRGADAPITQRLQEAFAAAVARYRNHEEPLIHA